MAESSSGRNWIERAGHDATEENGMNYAENEPRDKPYACGFDPRGKSLRIVVEHWNTCPHRQCKESAENYEAFK